MGIFLFIAALAVFLGCCRLLCIFQCFLSAFFVIVLVLFFLVVISVIQIILVTEARSIAREAGSRTKIAVWSNNPNVDAVGACVGMNGSRVNAIVDELRGEKIDIVNWDENPGNLIQNALSPAKIVAVFADPDERTAKVVVPDYQLSLAIGKEGQNARLAARLTGYKIDIKSETQARELGLFDDMDFGEEGFEGEYEKDVEPAGEEAPAENEAPAEETSEAQAETEE